MASHLHCWKWTLLPLTISPLFHLLSAAISPTLSIPVGKGNWIVGKASRGWLYYKRLTMPSDIPSLFTPFKRSITTTQLWRNPFISKLLLILWLLELSEQYDRSATPIAWSGVALSLEWYTVEQIYSNIPAYCCDTGCDDQTLTQLWKVLI